MTEMDYLEFKPIASSHEPAPWPQVSNTCDAATPAVPVPVPPAADEDIERYLPMEHLAMRKSHALTSIEDDLLPSDTFTSIPSSASAMTTAAVGNSWCAIGDELSSPEGLEKESPGASKVAKRSISAESFLAPEGELVRMTSLHSVNLGLEESAADLKAARRVNPQPTAYVDRMGHETVAE
jgi:hypothetical protein